MKAKAFLIGLSLVPLLAQAGQIYKCVAQDGHVTFSQSVCDDPAGTAQALDIQTSSGPNLPPVEPGNEQERLKVAVDWAVHRYPQLADNTQAAQEAAALRDSYMSDGEQPAEALLRAAAIVGPKYSSAEAIARSNAATEEARKTRALIRSGEPNGSFGIVEDSGNSTEARARSEQEEPKSRPTTSVIPPSKALIDPQTGQAMAPVAGGFVDPRTGTFFQEVAGGYVNSQTGQFIPK